MTAPAITTPSQSGKAGGRAASLARLPARPATELARMKPDARPDAARVSAQPAMRSTGLRKIPPPVPVRPDRKPIDAADQHRGYGRDAWHRVPGVDLGGPASRARELDRGDDQDCPDELLVERTRDRKRAPQERERDDPMTNGSSARQEMWPRRQNRTVTKLATTMLSASAVGRAISGATPRRPIAAR